MSHLSSKVASKRSIGDRSSVTNLRNKTAVMRSVERMDKLEDKNLIDRISTIIGKKNEEEVEKDKN